MSLISEPREGMIREQLSIPQRIRATLGRMRPGRDHLVDAGFTILVVVLAHAALRSAIFGTPWFVAIGVGLALGLFLGHIQATYRWPLIGISILTMVLYILLGGPLVVREDLKWGFLPTLTTFVGLAGAPIHGWKRWLTIVPPVDAHGQVLSLVLWLTIVSTILIYATARIHRSALLVVPVLALVVVTLLLGTQTPGAPWVTGLLLPAVVILWLTLRSKRSGIGPGRALGRPVPSRVLTGAAVLALAALVAGLVGPRLPGMGDPSGRSSLREDVTPGHDMSILASPLGAFRSYTRSSPARLWDQQLLTVDNLPEGAPLRLATLDSWDGTAWSVTGRGETGRDPRRAFQQFGQRVGVSSTAGNPTTEVSVSVPEGGYTGAWLPTTGSVHGVTFGDSSAERLQDKAWLNLSTDTVLVPPNLQPGDSYTLRTVLTPSLTEELPASLPVARGSMRIEADSDFVSGRINDWTSDVDGAWAKFVAVTEAMKSQGTYTNGMPAAPADAAPDKDHRTQAAQMALVYPPGHSRDRLDRFLNSDPLAGDDEQYAAALALIGNRLGIPTRVVIGAVSTKDGVIRGRDVHAWVEVQRADRTWYPVMPQTFLPKRSAKAPGTPSPWTAASVEPPAETPRADPPPPERTVDWSSFGTWPTWAKVLLLLVGLPLLVLLLTPVAAAIRRAVRARTGPPDGRVGRAWADLVDDARAAGLAVPLRATRSEQAMALGPDVDAMPLAVGADALVFGEHPPDEALVGRWLGELRGVRRRVRRSAGLVRWLLAVIDPRRILAHDVPANPRPTTARRKADRT